MTNMQIYNALCRTPGNAKKTIEFGRLKGKTDINPMYRIKALTELFGPCGTGWYVDIIDSGKETSPKGEVLCFMTVALYVKTDNASEWSKPIYGMGGNKLVSIEKSEFYADDDGWKKAYTDAIGSACKMLGMCADVYYEKDYDSKYSTQPQPETSEPQPETVRMATAQQIRYIKDCASDDQYMALMGRYGADLERLTYAMAKKAIDRIKGGAA